MKAVISKISFCNIINKIQSIVATKPAIPILSNVLIEAIDDQLILSATDLTTSMKCSCEAKVIEAGGIALPAKKFFQLIKELTSSQIKISTSNEIAEIISGSSLFKINGINKSLFPTISNFSGSIQIQLNSSLLREMLYRTHFSASRDDSRLTLNGISLTIKNQKAIFISTDGKRLSKIDCKVDIDPSFQGCYIIPLKAVEEIIKILSESQNDAILGLQPDKIFLENDNTILTTKLLSGRYPNTEKVIPKNIKTKITFHREELIALLRQISLFTEDTSSSICFIFEKGTLHLIANTKEIGEGNVSMPIDYDGEELKIAFNPFFLLDILKHSKDETIYFSLNDSYNPGMVSDSTSAIFVMMPMRLHKNYNTDNTIDDSKEIIFT
ncbi:MAG: hypothetical protein AMS24_01490 [Chlamydiae bacterium SM23_39]|nr:MAG: hypothetical protein AMS24_01490 [Chlamydiae bacterium SM23_39]